LKLIPGLLNVYKFGRCSLWIYVARQTILFFSTFQENEREIKEKKGRRRKRKGRGKGAGTGEGERRNGKGEEQARGKEGTG
jgi:hypothetical protein